MTFINKFEQKVRRLQNKTQICSTLETPAPLTSEEKTIDLKKNIREHFSKLNNMQRNNF